MKNKIKSVVFIISLILNVLIILLFILSSFSKTKFLSYYLPPYKESITAAAVVTAPADSQIAFNSMEIKLKPREKCFIQYSVIANNAQGNFLLQALYDPDIISISTASSFGIEITALSPGSTLIQSVNINGIVDIALIEVSEWHF